MNKTFCDICGKELDFWDYKNYNATYDIDMIWNEPHQSSQNGCRTLLYYVPPGDIHMNLCSECGGDLMKIIKDWKEEKENEKS